MKKNESNCNVAATLYIIKFRIRTKIFLAIMIPEMMVDRPSSVRMISAAALAACQMRAGQPCGAAPHAAHTAAHTLPTDLFAACSSSPRVQREHERAVGHAAVLEGRGAARQLVSCAPDIEPRDVNLLLLELELVGRGLDRHARAVEAKGEQYVVSLQALVARAELGLGQREGVP